MKAEAGMRFDAATAAPRPRAHGACVEMVFGPGGGGVWLIRTFSADFGVPRSYQAMNGRRSCLNGDDSGHIRRRSWLKHGHSCHCGGASCLNRDG